MALHIVSGLRLRWYSNVVARHQQLPWLAGGPSPGFVLWFRVLRRIVRIPPVRSLIPVALSLFLDDDDLRPAILPGR